MEGFALKPSNANTETVISGLMTLAAARRVFANAGQDLEKMRKLADQRDFKPVSTSARRKYFGQKQDPKYLEPKCCRSVEGSDPAVKDEFVIYSAHWDHLGRTKSKRRPDL